MKFVPWFLRAVLDKNATMPQIKLAQYLAERSDDSGLITSKDLRLPLADPTVIAAMIGVSKTTLDASLFKLEAQGLIEWTRPERGKIYSNDTKIQLILSEGDHLTIPDTFEKTL